MASQYQIRNIIKHGTNKFHANLFMCQIDCSQTRISDVFQCCGYHCYLFHKCDLIYSTTADVTVTLYGYPAPHKKQISCHYSITFVHSSKNPVTRNGEIHTTKEEICIDIFQGSLDDFFNYFALCFTWNENENSDVLSQGVQTEPECSNVVEKESYTKDVESPPAKDVCSLEEMKSNKFLEILSKDLSSFYEDKRDPDCVLRVGETKFPVHRSMLSARSSVFAAMFHHDTSERQSGEVDILDVDAGILNDVLYYIYAGKIRGLCPETAASMYAVSDKYDLGDLRDECLNFLLNNLTLENVCDAALLARTHAETNLENSVLHFIENRLEDLMQNDNWKKFSDTHFKLANYLLSSAFMAAKNKMKNTSSNA